MNFGRGGFKCCSISTSCDVDGIALDYYGQVAGARRCEIPAASLLTAWLTQVRVAISPNVPLFGVHHSSYASGAVLREGWRLRRGSTRHCFDASILFNYDNPFNAAHLLALAIRLHQSPFGHYSATMLAEQRARDSLRTRLGAAWRRVYETLIPQLSGSIWRTC